MHPYDCRVVTIDDEVYDFVIGGRDQADALGVCKFTAIHLKWVDKIEDIKSMTAQRRTSPTKRRPTVATEEKVSTFGSKEKETKNQVRYTSGWGVIYIPKVQLEKLGNPENVKITIEAAPDA